MRLLEPGDQCTGLSAGDASFVPLKTFFKKHSKSFHQKLLARTYIATNDADNKIIGYITLVCSQISTDVALVGGDFRYHDYPAVKIARLMIDDRFRDKGIGRTLVDLAVGIATDEIAPRIGCRFVVVDSKPQAVQFYKKRGFNLLKTAENIGSEQPLLYIDLLKSEAS